MLSLASLFIACSLVVRQQNYEEKKNSHKNTIWMDENIIWTDKLG